MEESPLSECATIQGRAREGETTGVETIGGETETTDVGTATTMVVTGIAAEIAAEIAAGIAAGIAAETSAAAVTPAVTAAGTAPLIRAV